MAAKVTVLSLLVEELNSGRVKVVDLTQPLDADTPVIDLPPTNELLAPILAYVYGTCVPRYVNFPRGEGYFLVPAACSLMFAAGVWLIVASFRDRRRA